ncbi:leucine-rich repeat domain-containing protein [Algibacillus agarilyticus]|uniref:leucine-rich repeat domain-containing protein n=1 Tax=Algibacillus agarilyticus TaxID=2234133 RepID=UPI000DD0D5FE|nr:leucine-rich repeat domain-containing protein [Algibacillus agarilyticus]
MQTLAQLKLGQLKGVTRLALFENLTEFPLEIFNLADSLEILDLSKNQLSSLPDDLHRLTKLRILFCSDNVFTALPACIGQCPKLEMIGFKANQIKDVPAESLPRDTRWLILTDNQIEQLPESMGELHRLEKCALAGNQLTALPKSLSRCTNLGLLRISANQLTEFPTQILALPKLAWLAFAGNPFCDKYAKNALTNSIEKSIPFVEYRDLHINQVLGRGASGVISHATWVNNALNLPDEVAIKVFKGEVTSDGYPEDELDACLRLGLHDNLVKPLAQIKANNALETGQNAALIMGLIPPHYINLGSPPSLESCTRDTFKAGFALSIEKIENLVNQMTAALTHIQQHHILHGDLYAHNVLIDEKGHLLFGDFGAASIYEGFEDSVQSALMTIEKRALGYFIADLLSVCLSTDQNSPRYQALLKRADHYLLGK